MLTITTASASASISPPTTPNLQLINRRHLLLLTSLSLSSFSVSDSVATARGLLQMPPPRLTNRAGESQYESLGIINTNPVAKTSVDSGLSDKGKNQTLKSALELKAMGACERNCWIWPSITQRAYQAAEIIAAVNGVSRRVNDYIHTHTETD
ncbi:hypothetical protein GOBAR_AA22874 [Gossypium barbadense]|uniref:Uncharacterized protein n=1 Tax=Gossypium barbadense TaxID=3634 RepID=A0A2P5X366_GOSBA|nr:hypothetical protein GOBAR_AA22874 [Gossypium barbadense]